MQMDSLMTMFPELDKIYQLSCFDTQLKQLQISIKQKNQNDLKKIKQLSSLYLYGAMRLDKKLRELQQKAKHPTTLNTYRQLSQNLLENDEFIKRKSANYYWCRCGVSPIFFYNQQEYLSHLKEFHRKQITNFQSQLRRCSHIYVYKQLHENPYFDMNQLDKLFILEQLDISKFYLCICNLEDNKSFVCFSEKSFKKHIQNQHFEQKPYNGTHILNNLVVSMKEPKQLNLLLTNNCFKQAIKEAENQIITKMIKQKEIDKIDFRHLARNYAIPLHKCFNSQQNIRQIEIFKHTRKNSYCWTCKLFYNSYSRSQHAKHCNKKQQKNMSEQQLMDIWWHHLQTRNFYLCSCNNVVFFQEKSYLNHIQQRHHFEVPPYSSHLYLFTDKKLVPNPVYSKQQLIKDVQAGKGYKCGFCPQIIVWKSNVSYLNHILYEHDSFHPQSSHLVPGLKDILLQNQKFIQQYKLQQSKLAQMYPQNQLKMQIKDQKLISRQYQNKKQVKGEVKKQQQYTGFLKNSKYIAYLDKEWQKRVKCNEQTYNKKVFGKIKMEVDGRYVRAISWSFNRRLTNYLISRNQLITQDGQVVPYVSQNEDNSKE